MAQNLSLTGFDLAFVEAWKVIDVTQEQFLVIDIGDINHDVVESLDAEKRNKLLQDIAGVQQSGATVLSG